MGLFRRRKKQEPLGLWLGQPIQEPVPPPPYVGEPVIDPETGVPWVDRWDGEPYDDEPHDDEPISYGLPDGAPPPVADPDERLRRLADLRDRGILSDEEFAAQRQRVLGS